MQHIARKRFGQHWLRDEQVLERILQAADLQADDRVLEVGPGRGALTERLLASPVASVHAIELDRDLVSGLRQRFAAESRFSLQEGDVLAEALEGPGGSRAGRAGGRAPNVGSVGLRGPSAFCRRAARPARGTLCGSNVGRLLHVSEAGRP